MHQTLNIDIITQPFFYYAFGTKSGKSGQKPYLLKVFSAKCRVGSSREWHHFEAGLWLFVLSLPGKFDCLLQEYILRPDVTPAGIWKLVERLC